MMCWLLYFTSSQSNSSSGSSFPVLFNSFVVVNPRSLDWSSNPFFLSHSSYLASCVPSECKPENFLWESSQSSSTKNKQEEAINAVFFVFQQGDSKLTCFSFQKRRTVERLVLTWLNIKGFLCDTSLIKHTSNMLHKIWPNFHDTTEVQLPALLQCYSAKPVPVDLIEHFTRKRSYTM